MNFTRKNVGEYWITRDKQIVRITNFDADSVYPIDVKFMTGRVEYYVLDGKVWDFESGEDLMFQITHKSHPEYFI